MVKNPRITTIIAIIVAILVIYWLFFSNKTVSKTTTTETVTEDFVNEPLDTLGAYYVPQSTQLDNYAVDAMTCHPSCCGDLATLKRGSDHWEDQWPVPFDGLTPEEIQKVLSDQRNSGPFVRSNYTCANGPNGVGCPCIPKDAYLNLVNRGQKTNYADDIEPTFLIGGPNDTQASQVYVNNRLMNDLVLQRQPQDLSNVQSYGSAQ